jgi:hypothetical protein
MFNKSSVQAYIRLTPALCKGEGSLKDTKLAILLFKVLSIGEDLGEANF